VFLLLTGLLSLRSALLLPVLPSVNVVDRGPRGLAGVFAFLPQSARPRAISPGPETTAASRPPVTAASRPAAGPITGRFHERRPGHVHLGIDISGHTGDPVRAAFAGTVVYAGAAPRGYQGYGTIVVLGHANGLTTLYAHLSRVSVPAGRTVAPGDVVGAMGCTGSCTGSHLHFEVRFGHVAVDPERYLPSDKPT
jgi:murein DD-endopeptidase MepM/ murein hydrolase activator NlpD